MFSNTSAVVDQVEFYICRYNRYCVYAGENTRDPSNNQPSSTYDTEGIPIARVLDLLRTARHRPLLGPVLSHRPGLEALGHHKASRSIIPEA